MANSECRWQCPEQWSEWSEWLSAGLHARNRWRLPVLLVGMLFAGGRRTVTTWLRAAGVSDDYQDYYYGLASLGRKTESVATRLLLLVLRTLPLPNRVLAVIDDSPTKRPFLRRVLKIPGLVVVGRLRKDAALRDLPPKLKRGESRGRGRPRTYGKHKISLAKRMGQTRGWQTVDCHVYGRPTTKTCKTFLATYGPVGGVIRVVLVKEDHGCYAFFCTDPEQTAIAIIEAFADRATIEQDFHDVKEVWGSGQQQVRNIWTNLAVYNLNLWMHALVELWAWTRPGHQLRDRRDSPWDDPLRRPSHADRRNALRRHILRNQLSTLAAVHPLPRKIIQLAQSLLALAH